MKAKETTLCGTREVSDPETFTIRTRDLGSKMGLQKFRVEPVTKKRLRKRPYLFLNLLFGFGVV